MKNAKRICKHSTIYGMNINKCITCGMTVKRIRLQYKNKIKNFEQATTRLWYFLDNDERQELENIFKNIWKLKEAKK